LTGNHVPLVYHLIMTLFLQTMSFIPLYNRKLFKFGNHKLLINQITYWPRGDKRG